MSNAIVLLSGGLDSTVTIFKAIKACKNIKAISFNYGQFHSNELKVAKFVAGVHDVPWECVNIKDIFDVANSSLLTGLGMNERSDVNEDLPASFVPGRNIMLLTAAAIYAYQNDASEVWAGYCKDDAGEYPDCELDFVNAIEYTIRLGFNWPEFSINTPLIDCTKADIFEEAQLFNRLGFVLHYTHTCYNDFYGEEHRHEWGAGCGECPSCTVRKKGWYDFIENIWNGGKPFEELLDPYTWSDVSEDILFMEKL